MEHYRGNPDEKLTLVSGTYVRGEIREMVMHGPLEHDLWDAEDAADTDFGDESEAIEPSVQSYLSVYKGKVYPLYVFDKNTHLSVSGVGDFADEQTVLVHMEDKDGCFEDMYYPSMRTFASSAATSESITKLRKLAFRFPDMLLIAAKRCPKARSEDIAGKK